MAIDTAAKRRSAAGLPFLPLGPGVTPDAGKGQAWRQQAGWGYSGILALEVDLPHGVVGVRARAKVPRLVAVAKVPRLVAVARVP